MPRGTIVEKVKSKMSIPVAETKLIIIEARKPEIIEPSDDAQTGEEIEVQVSLTQKIGGSISDTGKSIFGGLSRFGKKVNENTIGRIQPRKREGDKKPRTGGSALGWPLPP